MFGSAFFVWIMFITNLVLFVIAYKVFDGDIISPSVVTLGLFLISFACFVYNIGYWEVVFTFRAYCLFTISFVVMIVVECFIKNHRFLIGRGIYKSVNEESTLSDVEDVSIPYLYIEKSWNVVIVSFVIMFGLYYIYKIYKVGSSYGVNNLLYAIGATKEEESFDLISRLIFNIIRFVSYEYALILCQNVFVFKKRVIDNISSIIVLTMALLCMFFSGQRSVLISYVFGIIVIACVVIYDKKKTEKNVQMKKIIKRLVFMGGLLIAFFYLSRNIVKGRTTTTSFMEYLTFYFGSTTALMGRIVEQPDICHTEFVGYFGEKTFNGFYKSLYKWKIISQLPCDRAWIKMGGSTPSYRAGNEFTFFCAPYIDFGFVGTIIFMGIFYLAFSVIYYKLILNKKLTIRRYSILIIYSYLFTLISMSFYQDTIRSFSRPTTLVYFLFISGFTHIFLKKELILNNTSNCNTRGDFRN